MKDFCAGILVLDIYTYVHYLEVQFYESFIFYQLFS